MQTRRRGGGGGGPPAALPAGPVTRYLRAPEGWASPRPRRREPARLPGQLSTAGGVGPASLSSPSVVRRAAGVSPSASPAPGRWNAASLLGAGRPPPAVPVSGPGPGLGRRPPGLSEPAGGWWSLDGVLCPRGELGRGMLAAALPGGGWRRLGVSSAILLFREGEVPPCPFHDGTYL